MNHSDTQPHGPVRPGATFGESARAHAWRASPSPERPDAWSRARAPGITTRPAARDDCETRVRDAALREVEARLQRKSQLLDAILDQMVQGLMLVNKDHVVEVCNRRAIDLLGLPADLMAGQPSFLEVLEHQWRTDEFAHTPEELKHFVRGGGMLDQPQCYERLRPDGHVIEVQSVPLPEGGILRTYTDITERRRGEERMRYRARHDGLTSLLNRDSFIELLSETIMRASLDGGRFAVHFIDLDGFKPVNDALGHVAGDQVLTAVAQRMLGVTRPADAVARIGGDEFAILQAAVDAPEQAVDLADRLQRALEDPVEVDGRTVRIGLSAGIAIFPVHGVTPDALIRTADAALYQVKSAGGCGARVFDGPR